LVVVSGELLDRAYGDRLVAVSGELLDRAYGDRLVVVSYGVGGAVVSKPLSVDAADSAV
jgi:hypothetical protein